MIFSGSSGKRVPGRFAREASFCDVEEHEEAVAPSSTAAQKNCLLPMMPCITRAPKAKTNLSLNNMGSLRDVDIFNSIDDSFGQRKRCIFRCTFGKECVNILLA